MVVHNGWAERRASPLFAREMCVLFFLLFLDSYGILFIAVACEAFQLFCPDILINIGIDSPRARKKRIVSQNETKYLHLHDNTSI